MESVFVTGCNCFAGFQNSAPAKPDKKEKEKVIMLKSKKMLVKVGFTFTPSTSEACEFKDRMVYITVPAQPYTETSCLKKSPNQIKPNQNPPKRKSQQKPVHKLSSQLLFFLSFSVWWYET